MQKEKNSQIKIMNAAAETFESLRTLSMNKTCNSVGLDRSIYHRIVRGSNNDMTFTTFWRISEALDIKPSECMRLIEEKLNPNFSFIEEEGINE